VLFDSRQVSARRHCLAANGTHSEAMCLAIAVWGKPARQGQARRVGSQPTASRAMHHAPPPATPTHPPAAWLSPCPHAPMQMNDEASAAQKPSVEALQGLGSIYSAHRGPKPIGAEDALQQWKKQFEGDPFVKGMDKHKMYHQLSRFSDATEVRACVVCCPVFCVRVRVCVCVVPLCACVQARHARMEHGGNESLAQFRGIKAATLRNAREPH
jgi:hypothetical protein